MKKSSTLVQLLVRKQTTAFMVPIQPQCFIAFFIGESTKRRLISLEVIVT
jgi:hypothetical protein